MNTPQIKMTKSMATVISLGLCGIFLPVGHAASSFEQCPGQIGEREVRLIDGPAGWSGYSPTGLPLLAAGFMAGAPSTKTDLKPDVTEKRGNGLISIWKFDRGFLSEPDGLWLSCAYGKNGEITLSKKISAQFVECSVTYSEKKGETYHAIRVSCK